MTRTTRSKGALVAVIVLVGLLLFFAFLREPAGAQKPGVVRTDHDPVTTRLSDEGDPGELLYLRYCVGCHGVDGDGAGPAARFLNPKPRDSPVSC